MVSILQIKINTKVTIEIFVLSKFVMKSHFNFEIYIYFNLSAMKVKQIVWS